MKLRKIEMEVTKNRLANPDKLLRIAALVDVMSCFFIVS